MEKEMDERPQTNPWRYRRNLCVPETAVASHHQQERWRFETALIWPWK
jgi:hypothetical protein